MARISIILLVISISCANAQDSSSKTSVYIHPLSLFSNTFGMVNAVYLTVEMPYNLSRSLIVKPGFLREHGTDIDLFKLGSDIGMRHYLLGKGEGMYLQEQLGIFYYNNKDVADGDTFFSVLAFHPTNVKGLSIDAMCYLGYSVRFSKVFTFTDIGFGFLTSEKSFIDPSRFKLYFLPDFNFGIGISI